MTVVEAKILVQKEIDGLTADLGADCRILDERTLEREWGWVFFYDSVAPAEPLFGNSPLAVNRYTGELVALGTGEPPDIAIAKYEKGLHRG